MGVVIGRFFIISCKSLKLANVSVDGVVEGVVGGEVDGVAVRDRPANSFPEEVGG